MSFLIDTDLLSLGALRLCLAAPDPATSVLLWQGRHLTLFTLPPPDLIASRLIRYDPTDQADIQFLMIQGRVTIDGVAQAVGRLPLAFREDALVHQNLENLRRDLLRWAS